MNKLFSDFGENGFAALAAAFYQKVRVDDVVGRFYHQDRLQIAERRLGDFLIHRFGGSDRYLEEGGHRHLGMRHQWIGIGPRERDRWLEMMEASMDEVGLVGPARDRLRDFFTDTADALVIDDDVEDGKCPHLSDGPPQGHPFDSISDDEL